MWFPVFGWLSTEMVPPCSLTIPQTTARPRPVPPVSRVVKKGSKTFCRFWLGIPQPLSATLISMWDLPSIFLEVGADEDLATLLGPDGEGRIDEEVDEDLDHLVSVDPDGQEARREGRGLPGYWRHRARDRRWTEPG